MTGNRNPFEYEGANKLSDEDILKYYIEDHNYSRFIRSKRNILLVGDRGAGKSMALLYNSLPVCYLASLPEDEDLDLSTVCIHVPCNTPLTHKRDYELLGDFQAAVISEHFLVVPIVCAIADALKKAQISLEREEQERMRDDLNYIYGIDLPAKTCLWESIELFCQRQINAAQKSLNKDLDREMIYDDAMSFVSGVVPFLNCLKNTKRFTDTHFSLMLDDVHDLNQYQIATVNSWVAFRDNSLFSFKIATAKTQKPDTKTATGGNIIEGHDYTRIDMEGEYQNKRSDFGKLAKDIIRKRLSSFDIKQLPEEFFPVNPQFEKDRDLAREKAVNQAIKKYGKENKKAVHDYVYKYTRVLYFKDRSDKANVPTGLYTGFDMLVDLSTGIIRNLLEPCYWMYDKVLSKGLAGEITEIPPEIQAEVIKDRSKRKWDSLKNVHQAQECTSEQAGQLYRLFDKLAILFRRRLYEHESEPRAIKFMITESEHQNFGKLKDLLRIAMREQLLYTYESSGKEFGKRVTYYVPNKMLWPWRGLDPCGQHSVVSLKTSVLWAAATEVGEIPFRVEKTEKETGQPGLFDHE